MAVFGKATQVPAARISQAVKTPMASAKEIDSTWARMTRASNDSDFEAARAEFVKLVN